MSKPLKRHSAKKGAISLRIEPSKSVASACATVCIPLKTNNWVIDGLKCNNIPMDSEYFDETVVAYAGYRAACDKLMGNMAEVAKSKVTNMCCGSQKGDFLISATCAPNLSSVRKSAGIIIQSLKFGALKSYYDNLCKGLGARPDKEAFAKAVSLANAAMKDITVIFTGRVNAKEAAVTKTVETLAKKVQIRSAKGSGSSRTINLPNQGISTLKENMEYLQASGIDGILLHDYIKTSIRGINIHLSNGKLYFPNKKASQVASLNNSSKLSAYAKKAAKAGSKDMGLFAFVAASNCLASKSILISSGSPPTEASIKASLKKNIALIFAQGK